MVGIDPLSRSGKWDEIRRLLFVEQLLVVESPEVKHRDIIPKEVFEPDLTRGHDGAGKVGVHLDVKMGSTIKNLLAETGEDRIASNEKTSSARLRRRHLDIDDVSEPSAVDDNTTNSL